VDKQNKPKSNFEPGYDVKAKVVRTRRGTRGSAHQQLIQKFDLMKDRNPQTYGVGVKELWECRRANQGGSGHLHRWAIR